MKVNQNEKLIKMKSYINPKSSIRYWYKTHTMNIEPKNNTNSCQTNKASNPNLNVPRVRTIGSPQTDCDSLKDKINILKKVRMDNNNTNRQCSEEWIEQRKKIIGGSEIYGFLNSKDIKKFIKKKNSNSSYQNIFMMWGKVFEELAKELIIRKDNLVRKSIFEYGSLETTNQYIRYSPDLIGIKKDSNQIHKIVLYEIKCPYKTSCKFNLSKKQYLYQIKTGVEFLDFVDYGYLWCFDFKAHSFHDLIYTNFHTCGVLVFYTDKPEKYVNELICLNLEDKMEQTVTNFRDYINGEHKMEVVILNSLSQEKETELKNILTWFNKGKIKSILPWSLAEEDRTKFEKKKYFTNSEIEKIMAFGKEIQNTY